MYTLNITTKVDHDIYQAWLAWQKEENIPAIMETGCFRSYQFHQLLEQDESEGKTFVLQLVAETKEKYLSFLNIFADSFQKSNFNTWGENYFEFQSLLQNIG